MCGIVGVFGIPGALDIARAGLARLEYRGYDSAGLAWLAETGLDCVRAVGRVDDLPDVTSGGETLAIGHTRWATHGGVTVANAHPHLDGTGHFAVVHNGTLERHRRLRQDLQDDGHVLLSDTDSEAIVHLYERARRTLRPVDALRDVLGRVEGSWAVVLLDSDAGALVFARHRTPLLIGDVGDGRFILASDAAAVREYTDQVIFLDDGDHGIIEADGTLTVWDGENRPRDLPRVRIPWELQDAEKAGYAHFMLKEIHDAPVALNAALAGRIHHGPMRVRTGVDQTLLRGVQRLRILACGTSYHAALTARSFFEAWAGIPTDVEVASEFRARPRVDVSGTLTIGISQSGETLDTLEALRLVEPLGWPIIAVCNTQGSSLERMADDTILTSVGPEVGVAATKTFLGQVVCLAALALELAEINQAIPEGKRERLIRELERLPRVAEATLAGAAAWEDTARRLSRAHSLFFLGRGPHLATALEAALKFKEITYRHAEGIGAAELKHGPFALLSKATPCVFFVPRDELYDKNVSSMVEVAARDAPVFVVTQGDTGDMDGLIEAAIVVPRVEPALASIPFAIVGQVLSYEAAVTLGREVDRPRNLAKSVTVE